MEKITKYASKMEIEVLLGQLAKAKGAKKREIAFGFANRLGANAQDVIANMREELQTAREAAIENKAEYDRLTDKWLALGEEMNAVVEDIRNEVQKLL